MRTEILAPFLRRGSAWLAAAVALAVGLVYRAASHHAWANDRVLEGEPAWWQDAAPSWHAVVPESSSLAHLSTAAFDAITPASTLGDAHGLASIAIAATAAMLFVVMRRASASRPIALLLCLALAGPLVPVTAPVTVAYALQGLLGTGLMLAWVMPRASAVRRPLLAVTTIVGAWNHAAFLPFAIPFWVAEVIAGPRERRGSRVVAGAVVMVLGLSVAAAALAADASGASAPAVAQIAAGIITGRFPGDAQPSRDASFVAALAGVAPAPALMTAGLLAIAFAIERVRRVAAPFAAAGAAVLWFVSGTWVPDSAVGALAGRVALLVVAAASLSWIAARPGRPATILAIAAAALIGPAAQIGGDATAELRQTAELTAFAEAAVRRLGADAWTVDRLATARAILQRGDRVQQRARVPFDAVRLAAQSDEQPVIVLSRAGVRRIGSHLVGVIEPMSYPSAQAFLAVHRPERWFAAATRGVGSGFCADVLARLAPVLPGDRVALLVPPHSTDAIADRRAIDVAYGQAVGPTDSAPARITVSTAPQSEIALNRRPIASAAQGLVIAAFDRTLLDTDAWTVADCMRPPPLDRRRFGGGYLLDANDPADLPPIDVVGSAPVEVPIGTAGNAWFGTGWHAAEGGDTAKVRWTGALAAEINVLVSHRQSIEVRIHGQLAAPRAADGALHIEWNGRRVAPASGGRGGTGVWTVPANFVRRGLNRLIVRVGALVSPAGRDGSRDTRLLGLGLTRLVLAPAIR